MISRSISFYSDGCKIAGDFYVPETASTDRKLPAIVMCCGYGAIRSFIMPSYAEYFVRAGYVVLNFDYRGFGGSEGEKWRAVPADHVVDIRNAITWMSMQPGVDPERIGIWGTSGGAGNAIQVAGMDGRAKCTVAQVGYANGRAALVEMRTPEELKDLDRAIELDRERRVTTGQGSSMPIDVLLGTPETRATLGPSFDANPELRSHIPYYAIEAFLESSPIDVAHRISPRALMLLAAEHDDTAPPEQYRAVYDRAGEPKRWESFPVGHYEMYKPEWLEKSAEAAIQWFDAQL